MHKHTLVSIGSILLLTHLLTACQLRPGSQPGSDSATHGRVVTTVVKKKSTDAFSGKAAEVAVLNHNIGMLQAQKKQFALALKYLNKARPYYEQKLDKNAPRLAKLYRNFGYVYYGNKDYKNAVIYHQKAIAIWERNGASDEVLGSSYGNLALANWKLHQREAAIQAFERARQHDAKAYGKDSKRLILRHHYIGLLYWQKRDYAAAIKQYQQALRLEQKHYPANHSAIVRRHRELGKLYKLSGDKTRALAHFKQALAGRKAGPAKRKKSSALSHSQIAELYRQTGAAEKALFHYKKALQLERAHYGKWDLRVAKRYGDLGSVARQLGRKRQAIAYYRAALRIEQRKLGAQHPRLAMRHSILAGLYRSDKQVNRALLHYKKALAIRQKHNLASGKSPGSAKRKTRSAKAQHQ